MLKILRFELSKFTEITTGLFGGSTPLLLAQILLHPILKTFHTCHLEFIAGEDKVFFAQAFLLTIFYFWKGELKLFWILELRKEK